jgi:uncharacterized protein
MSTDLVEYIVKALVENPDEVVVSQSEDRSTVTVELQVAQEDMGRVIGKGGRVVNAIRTLAQIQAAKQGKRINLEVIE